MEWASFRRWLLPIGIAVAAYAAQRAFPPDEPVATGADLPAPHEEPPAGPVPQVEILGGPTPRLEGASDARLGVVTDPRTAEAARRRGALEHVLSNLDGAPVYVEGVDGPAAPQAQPRR